MTTQVQSGLHWRRLLTLALAAATAAVAPAAGFSINPGAAARAAPPAPEDPALAGPVVASARPLVAVRRNSQYLGRRTVTAGDATVGDGFVRFPVHGFDMDAPNSDDSADAAMARLRRMSKRQAEVSVANIDSGTIYSINLGIGTPPQPVEVIIDTGSSELWVNPDCSTAGPSRRFCASFPVYDPNDSSTVRDAQANGFIQYGKGNVTIRYIADHVQLGDGTTINTQIFGLATASNDIPMGILGLGPRISSKAVNYSFVLDTMATQKRISSRAFSLDLRSVDNPNGAVIFGGVDTAKYIGALEKMPIIDAVNTPRRADRYYIYMNSLALNNSGNSTTLFTKASSSPGQPVFLDSGGTLSRLPTAMFRALGNAFPTAQYDSRTGYYHVPCSVRDLVGSVDFGFGGKTIRVNYGDFIWQAGLSQCVLGVLPEDSEPVLGASFLRAAYVVYDQDNRNLHLAQAANCGAKVVSISAGADAVPSSTGLCTATGSATTATTTRSASATDAQPCTNCEGDVTVTVTGAATPAATGTNGNGAGKATIPGLGLLVAALLFSVVL